MQTYLLAPKPNSKEKMKEIRKPTLGEDNDTEYPTRDDVILKYIVAKDDEEEETDEGDYEEASSKEKKQKYKSKRQ